METFTPINAHDPEECVPNLAMWPTNQNKCAPLA